MKTLLFLRGLQLVASTVSLGFTATVGPLFAAAITAQAIQACLALVAFAAAYGEHRLPH